MCGKTKDKAVNGGGVKNMQQVRSGIEPMNPWHFDYDDKMC